MTIVFLNSSFSRCSSVSTSPRRLRVEVAGRLVGEQQRRIGDDGAGDRDALFLSARELTRVVLVAIAQADDAERGHSNT